MLYRFCSYSCGQCVYEISLISLNSKHVQVFFVHVSKWYMESRDLAPHIQDLSNRWSWVLDSTLRPFCPL